MGERAPASIWFYLEAKDAALARVLWPARQGTRYDSEAHDKLVDAGLLEVDEFNPGPNGENLNDVVLSSAGERELHRLAKLSAEKFEEKRRAPRAVIVPDRPVVDRSSQRPVPPGEGRGSPSGRPSRPVPQGNAHRSSAGFSQPKGEGA